MEKNKKEKTLKTQSNDHRVVTRSQKCYFMTQRFQKYVYTEIQQNKKISMYTEEEKSYSFLLTFNERKKLVFCVLLTYYYDQIGKKLYICIFTKSFFSN